MMEAHGGQPIEELELTSNLGVSDEINRKRISLKRLAKIVTATTLLAGVALMPELQETIYHAEKNIEHFDHDLIPVSASMLPKTLPNKVKAMEPNVLQALDSIDLSRVQESGSGIQINNNTLITAGHIFRNGKGNKFPDATWCNAFTGIGPRGLFRGVSQFSEYSSNSALDFALLHTKPIGKIEGSTHTVSFADKSYVGEPLYFINYQITPKGSLRKPSTSVKPAIYGGVVEGYAQNRDINVPTVVSYGAYGDYDARLASSGGPVFNGEGELVGITVQVYNAAPIVKGYSWLLSHIGLEKYSGNMQYTDAIVEPISSKVIDEFEASQAPFNCKN